MKDFKTIMCELSQGKRWFVTEEVACAASKILQNLIVEQSTRSALEDTLKNTKTQLAENNSKEVIKYKKLVEDQKSEIKKLALVCDGLAKEKKDFLSLRETLEKERTAKAELQHKLDSLSTLKERLETAENELECLHKLHNDVAVQLLEFSNKLRIEAEHLKEA
jgi:uncharacterized protein (DUF849 family)